MLYFYYQKATWDGPKNEIHFYGCYLGKTGKKFQVDGVKRTIPKGTKLYLCKIPVDVGNHVEEVFKLLTIHNDDLKNFNKKDIQLVGENIKGNFIFDKEFAEGMKQYTGKSTETIKLSEFAREREKSDSGS